MVTVDTGDVMDTGFQLQARTSQAKDKEGHLINATVFSGFAMKNNNSETFQIQLHSDGSSMSNSNIHKMFADNLRWLYHVSSKTLDFFYNSKDLWHIV